MAAQVSSNAIGHRNGTENMRDLWQSSETKPSLQVAQDVFTGVRESLQERRSGGALLVPRGPQRRTRCLLAIHRHADQAGLRAHGLEREAHACASNRVGNRARGAAARGRKVFAFVRQPALLQFGAPTSRQSSRERAGGISATSTGVAMRVDTGGGERHSRDAWPNARYLVQDRHLLRYDPAHQVWQSLSSTKVAP